MLKKMITLSASLFCLLALSLNAVTPAASNDHARTQLRDEIMEEDQLGGTDIFAIPLDESAVSDEALMDRMEGKPYAPTVPTKNTTTTPAR